MANTVEFGLTNVYIAKATKALDGTVSYGTPTRLYGGVDLAISSDTSGSDNIFYADNIAYYRATGGNTGFSGTLEIALLPDWFKTDILGQTKNADDILMETSNDTFSPFAMLYQVDGDTTETLRCFYYCEVSRPNENAHTIEDTQTPQTTTLNITISPRPDTGDIKAQTTDDTATSTIANWFTAVYEE